MKNKLHISKEVSFPRDAVTQTFAYIGRKGAGKTYLATMVAEQMLDIEAQTVVVDPVGVWWGLRVMADGRTKGKEIFVIGGDHGDVPLVPEAGKRIAELLVEKGISAVLDVSSFGIGERKRFCADFGEEFFQLKKRKRTPCHVYLEEAQLIVPQNIRPEEARMYSAFEQIVRLGRNYGIGCSLITQRPQSVNKEVLSQVECLCVLQVTGTHERKAIEAWVEEVGADRKLVGELPGLAQGEGYVWSPSWLRIFKRVHFSKKQTFDASATPEVGKKTAAARISTVDVEKLKSDIADVVAQAEKDNPVALRKRITELEKMAKQSPKTVTEKTKTVEVPVLKDSQIKKMEQIFDKMQKEAERHGSAMALFWGHFGEVSDAMLKALTQIGAHQKRQITAPVRMPVQKSVVRDAPRITVDPRIDTNNEMGAGERTVLIAVASSESGMTRQHITVQTGYKRSTRDAYIARLAQKGYVSTGDRIRATDEGVAALGNDYQPLPTGDELIQALRQRLPEGEWKILQILLENPGLDRESITEMTGFKRSTRDAYIARLASRELITTDRGGLQVSDALT